jgi:hypothetical protein
LLVWQTDRKVLLFWPDQAHAHLHDSQPAKGDVMRERAQKPFGLGGDIGLSVSNTGPAASDTGWRTSNGRDQSRPVWPRLGQIFLALFIVALMALGLHVFFY